MQLQLEGGASLQARLLVGADGRGSRVREWAQVCGRDTRADEGLSWAGLAVLLPPVLRPPCRAAPPTILHALG